MRVRRGGGEGEKGEGEGGGERSNFPREHTAINDLPLFSKFIGQQVS